MEQGLQPGGEGDEDAEADEDQPAEGAHRRQRPERPRGAALDRSPLLAFVDGAAQGHRQSKGDEDAERRLEDQQALDVAVGAQGRAEDQGEEHAGEAARRADGDAGGTLVGRQVVAGELADRAEDYRLGDRDGELSRHRPGKGLTAEAEQSAGCHQRPAGGE